MVKLVYDYWFYSLFQVNTCYPDMKIQITFFSWMKFLCKYTKIKVLCLLHIRIIGTAQFEKVVFGPPAFAQGKSGVLLFCVRSIPSERKATQIVLL